MEHFQMIEEVQGTIDWAKGKLENYPKAKKNLGPLLDALGREYNSSCIARIISDG
jgi:hypothetical protein